MKLNDFETVIQTYDDKTAHWILSKEHEYEKNAYGPKGTYVETRPACAWRAVVVNHSTSTACAQLLVDSNSTASCSKLLQPGETMVFGAWGDDGATLGSMDHGGPPSAVNSFSYAEHKAQE